MTFKDWLSDHKDEVVPEPTDREEVLSLLAVLDRELGDSESARSLDGKFVHAYWACLTAARVALRASGYRLRSVASHVRTIESLKYTLNIDRERLRQLQAHRAKRARAEYEMVDLVTDTDLTEARRLAEDLRGELRAWLRSIHPELLP